MTIGSLFAGIGGFDLAARWMGWRTAWVSEIEPYAAAVLKKHWPDAPNHGDITHIRGDAVERVDILCGGFPCQDISVAGKGAGLEGSRSGLWSHYARLIEEIRPKYIVAENVAALRGRGLDQVLRQIAALGYDAEWHCIPASAVGAPHQRDRIWIVAYPSGQRQPVVLDRRGVEGGEETTSAGSVDAVDASGSGARTRTQDVAHSDNAGRGEQRGTVSVQTQLASAERDGETVAHPESLSVRPGLRADESCEIGRGRFGNGDSPRDTWLTEPNVGRVAHGVPSRVDRLRCLGNALVPQVAYEIFQAIQRREEVA